MHAAGHRVVATDASPAMVELTRQPVPDADGVLVLALPDDPLPAADAIVSVGHALSYLSDERSVQRSPEAAAAPCAPGGVLAVDICNLRLVAVSTNFGDHRLPEGLVAISGRKA